MRPGTARAYLAMKEAAAADGIAMAVTSSYRDFERQLAIWNGKAEGKRPILDANGQPLDAKSLSDNALIDAILLWSALPGCSRHHLGTDIDVYAPDNISRDALKLELPEYEPHGPCHGLSCWLDANANRFGFFRPYQAGKSGVSPEPWHLSFAPEAEPLMAGFDLSALATHLERAPLALKSAVLLRLDELVERYVRFYAAPPVTEPSV
ncbi:M15 family metallopeptidase [Shewanella sp. JM162201]|uniref:M15 family metallopeptidase n=2 Tax=Shewanella jiangmenensis TaxID=2837387 RepID=A0ABS5V6I3_9GAMM|nr:M15 family metallopeptidase [Shewanella jiangmenensis]MBT1446040.1 M15 family metallopeptidase [Shewanella jiangmenensis]